MKISKILSILLLSLLVIPACDESEFEIKETEGGLVEVLNLSTNYVVGNAGPYTTSFIVYQGTVKTTKIELYKTFHTTVAAPTEDDPDATEPATSNEVLFETFDITDTNENSKISLEFYLDDLIEGLTIDGDPLPSNDGEYTIGDYWEFEVKAYTADGRSVVQNKTSKTTISTRYAGTYKIVEGIYWHPSYYPNPYVTDQWVGEEVIIQSIDAITYAWTDWGPLSGWESQTLYFQVDQDGNITYPEEWDGESQTLNDQPLYTCDRNYADVPNLPCSTSNMVINDDDNGKDRLKLSYAYYTAGSGPREFIFVLEKIVE